MYNSLFFGNTNIYFSGSDFVNGYFIFSDDFTKLNCDKKSVLCYDPNGSKLFDKLQSNCTFSDQC